MGPRSGSRAESGSGKPEPNTGNPFEFEPLYRYRALRTIFLVIVVQFTLHQRREAARTVPNFAQPEPIILAYGTVTCASAQVPAIRPARGCTRIAPNII